MHTETQKCRHTETLTYRHRVTRTYRHKDTQTHGHTDTQTHRHTDVQKNSYIVTQTHRRTDIQTHKLTDPQTERSYVSSEQQCQQQGLPFIPMILEAHGGCWGPAAKEFLQAIAREYANQTGVSFSQAVSHLTQRISTTLKRENPCVIMSRFASMKEPHSSINAVAWTEEPFDAAIDDGSRDVVLYSFQSVLV